MATYKTKITGLIGNWTGVNDRLTDYLVDGAQEIVNLVPKSVCN